LAEALFRLDSLAWMKPFWELPLESIAEPVISFETEGGGRGGLVGYISLAYYGWVEAPA